MLSESAPNTGLPALPTRWKDHLAWLGVCVIFGLLIAPVFYAMPPRMKFIGLHAWGLAACIGAGCAWAGVRWGIRSWRLIGGVSVLVALGVLLLQAHWGYEELKQVTAQRMPLIPLPSAAGSPEEVAQSLRMQRELAKAMVPTLTDFQRRRMNSPVLRRIRPLAFWGGELLTALIVCVVSSRICFKNLADRNSGQLITDDDTQRFR
jgi:hypothetical protein